MDIYSLGLGHNFVVEIAVGKMKLEKRLTQNHTGSRVRFKLWEFARSRQSVFKIDEEKEEQEQEAAAAPRSSEGHRRWRNN